MSIVFSKGKPSGYTRNWCPVTLYAPVANFKSMSHAARHLGVHEHQILQSIQSGGTVKNHFLVYSDMPLNCQPRKVPRKVRRVPVIWKGKFYPSILEAAGGDRREYMRIWRAAGRDRRK